MTTYGTRTRTRTSSQVLIIILSITADLIQSDLTQEETGGGMKDLEGRTRSIRGYSRVDPYLGTCKFGVSDPYARTAVRVRVPYCSRFVFWPDDVSRFSFRPRVGDVPTVQTGDANSYATRHTLVFSRSGSGLPAQTHTSDYTMRNQTCVMYKYKKAQMRRIQMNVTDPDRTPVYPRVMI